MNISKNLFIAAFALLFAVTVRAEDKHHDHKEHKGHEHGKKSDASKEHEGHKHDAHEHGEKSDDDKKHKGHEHDAHKEHEAHAKKAASYPLKTCVVSGEKLGSMGKAYEHVHKGQRVLFCCKGCIKKFNKAPEKHLKKVSEASHQNHDH